MTPSMDIPLPPGVPQPPSYGTNIHKAPKPTTPTDNLIHSKTRLTLTTHNTAKNIDNLDAIILRHQQQGTDILCLQEIPTAPSLHSLLNLHTFTNISSDKSNGTAIIIHSSLSPFVTQIKHDKVNGCLTAIDLTIPGYHTLRIINVYKSHHAHLQHRLEKTISALQQDQPCHIMLGDFNTYLQPSLDTANIKHNKYWPWLHDKVHPTHPTTTPTLIDLYRKDHPETKQWTRPANKRLPSHTRIDLILSSPLSNTIFQLFNTFIDIHNEISDHRPVSTSIAIPTNPINIYNIPHNSIHYRPLSKEEKSHFTSLSKPLNDWLSKHHDTLFQQPVEQLIPLTDFLFTQLVTTYKKVTHQAHEHKPTSVEKQFLDAVKNLPSTTSSAHKSKKLQTLLNDWTSKKQAQAHKKLHHSLISHKRIKKTINNILNPRNTTPISLFDQTGQLTTDPYEMCKSMGHALSSLGGPPDFDTDPAFIDTLMTNSPKTPNDAPLPHFTRDLFNLLLSNAKPHTAPGFDDTSLYLFSVCPPDIQTYIYSLCSLLIADHIPFHWLKANIFLLYTKGDPHNPTNYRPIALLNTLYKIIASYGAHTLTYYATTYHLTNNTQYGGLPNHRTADHIYTMIANLSLHPDMYHLYLDLNKAFNSVPHGALWQILSNYNIPHSIINLIQNLYACPHDFPVVNGFALFAAHCIRGLRQGCPMSPILFNLFVDPIINHIQSLLPKHEFNDLFSFIDDVALQTTSHATLHKVLHFLFVQGPRYGLSFNTTKSELHALNNATHITIRIGPTQHFSTFTDDGDPRAFYKYLGTYFFNKQQNPSMLQLLLNTIHAFFASISTLPLTHNEVIKLSNIQLIPTLTYRLIYNSLPQQDLDKLDTTIWSHISKLGKLSFRTPNKTKYSPPHTLGLNITKISIATHIQAINHILRYTHNDGPSHTNERVKYTLRYKATNPNTMQRMTAHSASFLGFHTHNIPTVNPCLPSQIPTHTTIEVAFLYYQSNSHPPTYSITKNATHTTKTTQWF